MYDPAMANFTGGSADVMVRQVAEGSLRVTERGLRRLGRVELDELGFEVERLLRQIRGDRPEDTGEDTEQRNRRIQRLNTCGLMLRTHRLRRSPGGGQAR